MSDPSNPAAQHGWRGVVRYPDPLILPLDACFGNYVIANAAVERLFAGGRWTEGPVWFGDGRYLLFSDIPNNVMLRWSEVDLSVNVFRAPSHFSNGNTRDREGRLVTCEHATRRVTRTEHDGRVTVLMDAYQGRRLNAPNDVVVKSDGSIWFTDPGYGILLHYEGGLAEFELPRYVYRLDPTTGRAGVAADDFDRPNGLCFSPDEKRLYIADTGASHTPGGARHIRVFDVEEGGRLSGGEVFADMAPGMADGIRADTDGNIWVAAGWGGEGYDGAHCYAPSSELIGKILLPEPCSNLCFGALHKNRLFMTAGGSLYSVYLRVSGAQTP